MNIFLAYNVLVTRLTLVKASLKPFLIIYLCLIKEPQTLRDELILCLRSHHKEAKVNSDVVEVFSLVLNKYLDWTGLSISNANVGNAIKCQYNMNDWKTTST